MIKDIKTNLLFECSCKLPIGKCKNLEHPLKMEGERKGRFLEGWALGKYSGRKLNKSDKTLNKYDYLKYGKLIHDYKYESFKLNDDLAKEMRRLAMHEINKSVDYFLRGYYPNFSKDFDTLIAVPSSRGFDSTIQREVCLHLSGYGLNIVKDAIYAKSEGNVATKNISGYQPRLKSIESRYEAGSNKEIKNAQRILVVDDIYDTGATLRTTVQLLNRLAPNVPKHFLVIAYII
jgi:predicted amidophosphoribosyltransferase